MALYKYQCEKCGRTESRIRSEKKKNSRPKCGGCGNKMNRIKVERSLHPETIAYKQLPGTIAYKPPPQSPIPQMMERLKAREAARPRRGRRGSMENVTIVGNFVAGMVLNGQDVEMKNVRIDGAQRGIIANNSRIDGEDIDIS